MTIQRPPEYVVVPYEILEQAYLPDKPHRALFTTFVRLLALAWQNKYEQTPRLLEDDLHNTFHPDGSIKYGYLKLSRRQYFEQVADMQLVGWLRSSHPAAGFVQFSFSRAVNAEKRTASAENPLVVGGESIEFNLNTDSLLPPLTEASAEKRTDGLPGVKDILYYAEKLFDGAAVSAKDLDDREPLYALAWCAYAYREKGKLTGPGGLVRKRLLDNQVPPEWAQQQWQETLPCDFLEALHLIEYSCDVCQATFGKLADLTAHEATHPAEYPCHACDQTFGSREDLGVHYDQEHMPRQIQPDESVRQRVNGSLTPEQAWQSVLGQLQLEMPRASFETWVRDTRAVRYDGNTLYIGVRNAYARDWLESRLASTVERLLVGILNTTVEVVFVVAEDIEVEP